MTANDISQFVNSEGIPGSLIVFGCFVAWRWGWWLLMEIIQPVAKKAIEFMEHLTEQVSALVTSTQRMCDSLAQISHKQLDHDQRFDVLQQAVVPVTTTGTVPAKNP